VGALAAWAGLALAEAFPDAWAEAGFVADADGEAEGDGEADGLGDGLAGADVTGADGDGVPAALV
jgi:hypothetical protein